MQTSNGRAVQLHCHFKLLPLAVTGTVPVPPTVTGTVALALAVSVALAVPVEPSAQHPGNMSKVTVFSTPRREEAPNALAHYGYRSTAWDSPDTNLNLNLKQAQFREASRRDPRRHTSELH